jgi:YNFM family putative membrane transporter
MMASAALICVPTALAGLAPNLPSLLAVRACQGLCMPGLLVVAVPYVTERFRGRAAGAAMGAYTASLVFGGLVGRVGTALVADVTSWRVGLEALTVPSVAGAVAMRLWLPRDEPRHARRDLRAVVAGHLQNRALLLNGAVAGTTFFGFVGVFTYATHRLTAPALGLSLGQAGLVYAVWVVGLFVPAVGHVAQRAGPARLLPVLVGCALVGAGLTLIDSLPVVIAGMALQAGAMFSTVTTSQLLIPRLVTHHRGTATSVHLTIYYVLGGAGAYVPGLWLDAGWGAVVAACSTVLGAGFVGALVLVRLRPAPGPASDTLANPCSAIPPTS